MVAELPATMRYLLEGVRLDLPVDSPAFLASLDARLPPELRRRYHTHDLVAMGIDRKRAERGGPLARVVDGRDAGGRYWHYSTLLSLGLL